jgi:hypothetical protein
MRQSVPGPWPNRSKGAHLGCNAVYAKQLHDTHTRIKRNANLFQGRTASALTRAVLKSCGPLNACAVGMFVFKLYWVHSIPEEGPV